MGPTQETEDYFNRGMWGYRAAQWRQLTLLWGYTDRWAERFDTVAGDTNITFYSDDVPTGYVYVLEGVSVRDITSGPTNASVFLRANDSQTLFLMDATGVAQWRVSIAAGRWTMKEGDSIAINMVGVVVSDVIEAAAWGYMMRIT